MVLLKKYRDGVCTHTDRFENHEVANRFKKQYVNSYHAETRKARNIYAKIVKLKIK